MNYDEYVSQSNLAFAGGEYLLALEYAQKAIAIDQKIIKETRKIIIFLEVCYFRTVKDKFTFYTDIIYKTG